MVVLKFLSLYILLLCNIFFLASSLSDVELLLQKKPSLQGDIKNDNFILSSWNSSSVPLCQWRGLKLVFSNGTLISCDQISSPQWTSLSLFKNPSLHLQSIQLPSANLSGSIPRELGEFSLLQSLYLNINSLTGSIPLELGYSLSLSDIDLSGNLLIGVLPPSLWNLCDKLVSVRIHGNSLSGSLPEPALPNSNLREGSSNFKVLINLGFRVYVGFEDFLEFRVVEKRRNGKCG